MSGNYDNTNQGVLFKNEDKDGTEETEKYPDYKGSLDVDGAQFWLSAWINKSEKVTGGKFIKLKIKAKDEQPASRGGSSKPAQSKTRQATDDLDDDLPF